MLRTVVTPVMDRIRFDSLLQQARMQAGLSPQAQLPTAAREYFWNHYRMVVDHLSDAEIVEAWTTYLRIMTVCHVIA